MASAINLEQDGGGSGSEAAGPPTPAYGGSPSEAGQPTPAYGGTPHDPVVGQLLFAGVKEEASSGAASASATLAAPEVVAAVSVLDATGATAHATEGGGSAAIAETRALGMLDIYGAYLPLPAGATYKGGTASVLGKGDLAVHEVMHGQGAPRLVKRTRAARSLTGWIRMVTAHTACTCTCTCACTCGCRHAAVRQWRLLRRPLQGGQAAWTGHAHVRRGRGCWR